MDASYRENFTQEACAVAGLRLKNFRVTCEIGTKRRYFHGVSFEKETTVKKAAIIGEYSTLQVTSALRRKSLVRCRFENIHMRHVHRNSFFSEEKATLAEELEKARANYDHCNKDLMEHKSLLRECRNDMDRLKEEKQDVSCGALDWS